MKPTILCFFFFLCFACVFSSCTVLYRFMVVNKSKKPVEVSYKLISLPNKEDSTYLHSKEDIFWFPYRSKRAGIEVFAHSFDETTNTYTFTLPAKKRATIGEVKNTKFNTAVENGSRSKWNLEHLRIKTPTKEIYHTVKTFKQLFSKHNFFSVHTSKVIIR